MTDLEQKRAAKQFAEDWKGRGYEKGESQTFWLSLLQKVYGVQEPDKFITFEEQVHLDNTSFIDGYIPSTRVMIEQKSLGKDLNKAIKQSDGSLLNPFQQAKRYITELPVSKHPRWVVTCNFGEFYVYDMENPRGEPEKILLADLEKEYYRLQFLVDVLNENLRREMEISIKAGDLIGILYDKLLVRYKNPESPETLHSLNALCVRLVFCLFAEDAGIFGSHLMFHDYLRDVPATGIRRALADLFKVLDQKPDDRDPYLADDNPKLAAFPYVNGGLFSDENIEIPSFTDELKEVLLSKASEGFDWSKISPTIFGAVFESTLNPDTRRSGGMHYTSIENIHKVIDPLFLDDLKKEFEEIKVLTVARTRKAKLEAFQGKLASLSFLDPACGSGNFLTESYLCLRRLENEVISELYANQVVMEMRDPIKVGINQFYGIEINDFAVSVAKTALWIAESQMMKETEDIVHMTLDFLPLHSYANIRRNNALRVDWESVVPRDKLTYIMGNPPFVGYTFQTDIQKEDLLLATENAARNIDYVSGWYFKAAKYMQNTSIRAALVSTNSITQGEQVAVVWEPLYKRYNVHIDFAHRTFRWDSEAKIKAHVHCVIIGFSTVPNKKPKMLFSSGRPQIVDNINAYLLNAPDVFVKDRRSPLCPGVTIMNKGSQGTDDGLFYFTVEEYNALVQKYPHITDYLWEATNGQTFLSNTKRYCLWCAGAKPAELKKYPELMERVRAVKALREASKKAATRKWADFPYLFTENRQPTEGYYLLLPLTSSERRKYVPIGYLPCSVIANNSVQIMPNASLYDFGILTSNVFMAWMRAVCGRLEMRYRITVTNVYNNFPWPTPTDAHKAKIVKTAQEILNARTLYQDASLADLYDEVTMPPELRKAHQHNDRAVMDAYGFDYKTMAESDCVAELMKRYLQLTEGK